MQAEPLLPSGLWLAVDLPEQASGGFPERQLRVFSDPLAVPPGLEFEYWTAEELEAQALGPIRAQLRAVRGWTYGLNDSCKPVAAAEVPLAIDRASGLYAWRTPPAIGWPPQPSAWLEQVQAVVRGSAAAFV